MDYKYILFDLDGTLTDPAEGITKCVKHALESEGVNINNLSELLCFIGPPLVDSFMNFYGFDKEKSIRCLNKYRERFSTTGIYENMIYDGIDDLLCSLKTKKRTLILATSKPYVYANRILEHFNISQYFDFVFGPELSGHLTTKSEIIQKALCECGEKEYAVMIGDRHYDICGAHENGIDAIGVTYGYAKENELSDNNAEYIVNSVDELKKLLLN